MSDLRLASEAHRLNSPGRPSEKGKLGKALESVIATLKKNGTLKKLAIVQQIPVSDVE
ncbi:MAG: hypothetical protein ACTHNB_15470 [Gaiellaceae bacterium]